MVGLNALARHLQPQAIKARERGQVRAIKGSIGHVEVFQMDGVGTPIIGRPRPLPSHDTPNPAHNTYTLKCEEPLNCYRFYPSSLRMVLYSMLYRVYCCSTIARAECFVFIYFAGGVDVIVELHPVLSGRYSPVVAVYGD